MKLNALFADSRTQSEISTDVINESLPWLPASVNDYKCDYSKDGANIFHLPFDGREHNVYRMQTQQVDDELLMVWHHLDIDGLRVLHRIGGPACYFYNYETRLIQEMSWSLFGRDYKVYDYWHRSLSEMPQVYKKIGTKVYKRQGNEYRSIEYASINMVPCPSKIYPASERLVWRLEGHEVSVEHYWTLYEQLFSVLPQRAFVKH
jgi:hypothetical protein